MKLAVIAAIMFAVAPFAHAQTICEEVARINESGLGGFDSIRGPYLPDRSADELSESDATLFGGYDCLIDQYFEPRHSCAWEFATEAELLAAYAEKAAAIAPCLAGWERQDLLVSGPNETHRVLAGAGYLGAGDYEVIVWEIVADFDAGRAAGEGYRLSFTAIDYTL